MDGSKTEKGGRWPPARLRPLPPRLRRLNQIGWAVLALIAFVAVVGGAWRGYVSAIEVMPRFTAVGLFTEEPDHGPWTIGFMNDAAEAAGVRDGSRLVAVNGRAVPTGIDDEAVSKLLAGPAGTVDVTLRGPDGRVATHRLTRAAGPPSDQIVSDEMFFAVTTVGGVIGALATLVVALMLARRRTDDAVSMTLSMAFVAFVAGLQVTQPWWEWLRLTPVGTAANVVALTLFALAIPAFPDGRYIPRWGGWLVLGAVPVAVLMFADVLPYTVQTGIVLALALAIAVPPIQRFRATPQGIERQQLKWVAFGFFGAAVILIFASAMLWLVDFRALPFVIRAWMQVVAWVLMQTGILLMPVGVLVAIRRYRLWDADRVIGRSAGWAVLTLIAAAVWAASTTILEGFVETTLGEGNKGLSAGLSTILALVVLGPVRDRVVTWMDARFRSGLIGLRALPQRLRVWQHGDSPEDIGGRVSRALTDLLRVPRVAVLIHRSGGYACVGSVGVAPAEVAAWIAAEAGDGRLPAERVHRGDPLFPLRIVLDDADLPIGALLLGARADGSLYGKDERAGLDAIEPVLAATLRQAQRRQVHDTRLAELIAKLEHRIGALERRDVIVG